MNKRSKALDIVFHRTVFAAVLLLYLIAIITNYFIDFIPTPWGMYLFVPVIIFGLIGYLLDEAR